MSLLLTLAAGAGLAALAYVYRAKLGELLAKARAKLGV